MPSRSIFYPYCGHEEESVLHSAQPQHSVQLLCVIVPDAEKNREFDRMLLTTACQADTEIRVIAIAGRLDPELEARVEAIWRDAVRARGDSLFNGRIASVMGISGGRIDVRLDEYRRWIAARTDESLASALGVRPLAVSGLFRCADGIVFGRRSRYNTEAVGQWELVPSGGIDAHELSPGAVIDPVRQVVLELEEELGVPRGEIEVAKPFCVVMGDGSGVVDLGIEVIAPALCGADILSAHHARGSREYSELLVVSESALREFLASQHRQIVDVSLALLDAAGASRSAAD